MREAQFGLYFLTKVVHMTMNPADEAAENYANEMDKLRAEVKRNEIKHT